MADNTLRFRAVIDDKVSGPLDRMRGKFDTLGKSGGFKSVTQGLGVGLGIGLYSGLQTAIGGVVSVVGDAIHAAIEDEASQQKLGTALKANVKNWDGNTDAIEKTLTARMKLGFSDDEQRDSLARLVAATGDVTRALDIQRTAMDLARLKGISLADASDALTKVEAGSFRILKSLGIELKKGATQQDALNAVQKIATGQAEDYSNTLSGKLIGNQVAYNEALEKLGYKLLPVAAVAADAAAVAIDGLTFALGDGTKAVGYMNRGIIEFIPGLNQINYILTNTPKAMDEVTGGSRKIATGLHKVTEETDDLAESTTDVTKAFNKMTYTMKTDVAKLLDEVYDPLIERDKLLAQNAEIAAAKRVLASSTASAAERRDATATLHSVSKDKQETLFALMEAGKLTSKEQASALGTLQKQLKTSSGKARADIQLLIDKWLLLASINNIRLQATVSGVKGGVIQDFSKKSGGPRAAGGPVDPWEAYTVGEKGPETLVMGSRGGTIVPNGAGGMTLVVNTIWPPTPAQLRLMASALDQHNGYRLDQAPPTRSG